MSITFNPHLEILPPAQCRLWPALGAVTRLGFVLYGGTAIALRLGHRVSVDFDFFSTRSLNRDTIRSALPLLATATVLQDDHNTWTLLVAGNEKEIEPVKLSFFGLPGFGQVEPSDATADGVLRVAALNDLMASKLKVILQRAEAKDYRDIAAMLRAGVDLSRGLAAARAIYGMNFQPSESLKALVYFEDGDLRTLNPDDMALLVKASSTVRRLPDVALLSQA